MNSAQKKSGALLLFLLPVMTGLAKGGGKAPEAGGETNWLEILMIFVAIVLLVVIWGLGQALIAFNRQLAEKRAKGNSFPSILLLIGLLGATGAVQAQETAAAAAEVVKTPNYGGLSGLDFFLLASVIGLEVLVILFLAFMARRTYRALTGAADKALAVTESAPKSGLSAWWSKLDKNIFTRAVPVEQEADVMLDHDYDGIRELDNALPPWWKWGFYITIVVGVFYILYYMVFDIGLNPEQEYAAEIAAGKRQEEAYKARTKDLIDENNITLADASGIAAGKALYIQSCVACHAADGGGGIGPNLTDDYWIHGGGMNDIYKTIKIGYPDKGMQAWESVYSPMQMRNISSFVKSLKGTKAANPKAPQGDLFTEGAPAGSSSSSAPADSSAAPAN